MNQQLQTLRHSLLRKRCFNIIILLCLFSVTLRAQSVINTTSNFTNDSTVSIVTFNFQNTNSYPVIINNIEGIVADFGVITTEVWYKSGAITTSPGIIGTASGWSISATGVINGAGNTTTQPFFNTLSLTVPANTTYGIAVAAYGNGYTPILRVGNSAPSVNVSSDGCNFITGNNIGYSTFTYGTALTQSPKGWIGKIKFINGATCSGVPNTPTISGPASICSGAMFSLTSTGASFGTGFTYIWQKYNSGTSTWDDITGATSTNYNVPGIAASTQFRLKTTCSGSGLISYSNTVTVNIGTGLAGGTYTINQLLPSTSTNFVSFNAAAAAMQCGITGAVTFNVVSGSGPYNEMVTFGNITGASAVNKIRINGHSQVIQFITPIDTGIINLNGTKYMTIDSLTVRSLATDYGIGINMLDSAAHDSVMHCFIDMRSLQSNYSNTAGISQGGWNNYNYLNDDNLTSGYIGYNHILGTSSSFGMYFGIDDGGYYNGYQNDNGNDTGNVIEHNLIENFSYIGIATNGNNGTKILYNDINRTTKTGDSYTFIGIDCITDNNYYLYGNADTVREFVKIIGNRIHDGSLNSTATLGFTGIELGGYYWNNLNAVDSGSDITVANNVIYNIGLSNSSSWMYGIYVYGGNGYYNNADNDTFRIYHNTIDFSQAVASNNGSIAGIYYYDYYGNTNNYDESAYIYNNLITLTASGPAMKYGFYYYNFNNSSNVNVNAQRNNFYVNSTGGTQYYGRNNAVDYSTLADYHVAFPNSEVGSLTVDPQYISPSTGDYTPTNLALMGNGKNLQSYVPTDILGRPRPIAPTPGAFEIGRDAGVTTLLSPVGTYCSSVKLVQVLIKNFGLINIDNVQIGWSLNGVLQTPVNYTTVILPNATAAVNLGNGLFMPSTPVTIKAWTYLPNGIADGYPTNDTLTITTQSSTSVPVDIGPDDTVCTGNTVTLDAGFPGSQYVWDNSTYNQTRTIQNAGTYYVKVTAFDGCIGVDTMKLTLRPLPVVDLGPQQAICEGSTTTLNAGNPGASYLWDDGSTQQTRVVDTAGHYEAQVTDQFGCKGVGDVDIIMKDMPTVEGINATHADSGLYTFYPLNPMYVISYSWDFGDGSPDGIGYMVQHAYAHNGIYTVTLSMVGECTGLVIKLSRTVDVFNAPGGGGTGINNPALAGAIDIYPNPSASILKIENKSDAKMNRVVVYNALGQTIINEATNNTKQHQLSTTALANGLYSIRVETDNGSYVQKFEVMR